MIQQVNLNRLYDSQTTAVSVDPIIQIGYATTCFEIWLSNFDFFCAYDFLKIYPLTLYIE